MLFDQELLPQDNPEPRFYSPELVLYADPPWRYETATPDRRIENKYDNLSNEEIEQFVIPGSSCSVLFLWATAPKLPEALGVLSAWRYEFKTCMVWDKVKFGMGWWFRGQHELLLVGTIGKVSPPRARDRIRSVWSEPRGKHSRKPDGIREMIERWYPDSRRVEVFCRERHPGWEVIGNEVQDLLWSDTAC